MSSGPTLDCLPPELLLHICSFLDADFLVRVLSKVCRLFHDFVHDESMWKSRYLDRWSRQQFFITDKAFDWKEACTEREEQFILWKNSKTKMGIYVLPEIHFGFVDSVHILKNGILGVSASRDGTFGIWNLEKLRNGHEGHDLLEHHQTGAHMGWISCLDSFDASLFTGGWDKTIRGWDLSSFSSWEAARCTTSVLCMTHTGSCLCIGTFHDLTLSDTRVSSASSSSQIFKYHKRPVLCVAADERYIISGSEDKSVVVHDRVAGKRFSRFQLGDYPRCFSYDGLNLWLGDRGGNLHLLKPTQDSTPQAFLSVHESQITGVIHSLGSLITCSTDRTVKAFEPSWEDNLIPIATEHSKSEQSYIAKHKNTLMVASAKFSPEVWLPSQVNY